MSTATLPAPRSGQPPPPELPHLRIGGSAFLGCLAPPLVNGNSAPLDEPSIPWSTAKLSSFATLQVAPPVVRGNLEQVSSDYWRRGGEEVGYWCGEGKGVMVPLPARWQTGAFAPLTLP